MSLIPFKNVLLQQSAYYLNAESTTFLLLCFLSLVKLGKYFFYFTSKTITVQSLERWTFKYHDAIKSLSTKIETNFTE